jgi:hypothetical protein
VKEDHDLPDDLLLRPGVRDPFGSNRADARHLAKPIGFSLDDVEDLLTEGLDHLLGIDSPMPRITPEPRYFSIPSIELGADALRNRALNC